MRSNDNDNKYTYNWNDASTFNSASTRRITQKGKYWVKIKDEWGNVSLTSDTLYFGVEPPVDNPGTGIKTFETNVFTYNNPVKDVLNIRYLAPTDFKLFIQLTDIRGRVIRKSENYLKSGSNQIQIPVSGFAEGIYILQLFSEKGNLSRKIIISPSF
jgi:hypothetical protein